jgi:nicotinate-nucleotide pyrophosphorylase (carboxylating)
MEGNRVKRNPRLEGILTAFLSEDMGFGDITSNALIPRGQNAVARLYFKEPGVVAGLEEVATLFSMLGCKVKLLGVDGGEVDPKEVLLEARGDAKALLAGERVALNLISHLAGIATATRNVVVKARKVNPKIRVAATRKTLPGLRDLEKKAVELGGGDTHRLRLDDCVLIKDNHLELLPNVTEAIRLAREKVSFTKKIEIEVRSTKQAEEAARAGAEIIMLDNMNPSEIKSCLNYLQSIGLKDGRLFEASGGINASNLEEYAASGVDIASLGSLTHSVRSLDVKLEIKMSGGTRV